MRYNTTIARGILVAIPIILFACTSASRWVQEPIGIALMLILLLTAMSMVWIPLPHFLGKRPLYVEYWTTRNYKVVYKITMLGRLLGVKDDSVIFKPTDMTHPFLNEREFVDSEGFRVGFNTPTSKMLNRFLRSNG